MRPALIPVKNYQDRRTKKRLAEAKLLAAAEHAAGAVQLAEGARLVFP